MKNWLGRVLSIGLVFFVTALEASTPLWTLVPTTPTNINVAASGKALIQYVVTNQSTKAHTLVMTPIVGIKQITAAGSCASPFLLAPSQSCKLTLEIDGSFMQGNHIGGPKVCQNGNPLQCYQPSLANSLNITVVQSAHTLGGTVSGLTGGTVVLKNGNELLPINANGSFTFATPIPQGSLYHVTVQSQPVGQICSVSSGTGIMHSTNVTNVTVVCSANSHTVGGTVSGLTGTVVLLNNGDDALTINADGVFTFSTPVAEGSPYVVTVQTQPAGQICTVGNAAGIMGASNVTNVTVVCSTSAHTVGGTISGLVGTVVLLNNGSDALSLSTNGAFTFPTTVAQGAIYHVTVQTQPATQTCSVSNGTGIMGASNVTNVTVVCSVNSFTVGGMISGLSGTVILENNNSDPLVISANGSFTFSNPVAQGSFYHVTVQTQPAGQTCTVSNGTGFMGSANVTNVTVICSVNSYTVGGTVNGLVGTVDLQLNGGDTLSINTNGAFTFPTPVAEGSPYLVTILTQPAGQTCSVAFGFGIMGSNNVTSVEVTCSTNAHTVGGTVTGLTGTVTLRNNGNDLLVVTTNGPFTFPTPIAEGSIYLVTIAAQPVNQTCTVTNRIGRMGTTNVTNVLVTCLSNAYTVGGTVSGLVGTVVLQNNGSDNLSISSDGPFNFSTPVTVGSPYNVTVFTQPAGQTCTVSDGSGIMGTANVTDVSVVCSVNSYTVGGVVSGLTGTVVLLNNGQDSLSVNSNGPFTFATPVAEGSFYHVTIQTQPVGQTCSVSNGTGRMGGANVTNVAVVCATNAFTVGGTVSGLIGTVVLQNNNTDSLTISADGLFTFSTPIAQGSPYAVTVQTQPAAQTCVVSNGTGTMGGANVTNVLVTCSTDITTVTATKGTIPVNGGNGIIVVTNTGSFTALNVEAVLPAGWTQVTQDATNCVAVSPGGTCQLLFTSPVPYVAQRIAIVGDNVRTSDPQISALAFSIDGYLVFSVDTASTASVIDATNNATIAWDSALTCSTGSCVATGATSNTDGAYLDFAGNTYLIISGPNPIGTQTITGGNAAGTCYNITTDNSGAVLNGTWYLSALCQMVSSTENPLCPPGLPNISTNLAQYIYGNLIGNRYWSSTESTADTNNAWAVVFSPSDSASFTNTKADPTLVRCVRSINY